MTMPFAHKPIGFLLDHLGHFQWQLFKPIEKVLKNHGYLMVSFVGYELDTVREDYRRANHIFGFANSSTLSGLIALDGIGHFVENNRLADFLNARGVPMVNLSTRDVPGIPNLMIDQEPGMRALMRHLLDERNFRKLVFVRGWPDNTDSCLREQIFCEELLARGLEASEATRVTGRFNGRYAAQAILTLLEAGSSFEAVVAANDLMARGIIDALRQQGIRVPQDVAVVGFDDDPSSAVIDPPLTTVKQPLAALAEAAAELLVAQLHGLKADVSSLATELIVRASCGSPYSIPEAQLISPFDAEERLNQQRHRLITLMDTGHGAWGQNSLSELLSYIRMHLTKLEIESCHIVLYDEAGAYLALAHGTGGKLEGQRLAEQLLLPDELDLNADLHHIALPLFTPEANYGHMVLGVGALLDNQKTADDFEIIYSSLRRDISNGLHLTRQREALAAYTASLEEKVRERTRQLELANQELARQASTDGLTGLNNRTTFDSYLSQHWAGHRRQNAALSLILCDVDHFKLYNDHYGHLAGDACLKAVAEVLAAHVRRPYDFAARYGGEEFAILLPYTDKEGALSVATKILHATQALVLPHALSTTSEYVSLSMGISTLIPEKDKRGSQDLIAEADEALYQAKRVGRNTVIQAGRTRTLVE
ncbi:MAG: diguanylate cyclase [Trueperaceae bacterium]|nr:diguanylate cyclase [Trueperaceae bacterium]